MTFYNCPIDGVSAKEGTSIRAPTRTGLAHRSVENVPKISSGLVDDWHVGAPNRRWSAVLRSIAPGASDDRGKMLDFDSKTLIWGRLLMTIMEGTDVRANEKGRDETGKNHQTRSHSGFDLETASAERV